MENHTKKLKLLFKRIGTMIDPDVLDGNLTAYQHLAVIATAAGIPLKEPMTCWIKPACLK